MFDLNDAERSSITCKSCLVTLLVSRLVHNKAEVLDARLLPRSSATSRGRRRQVGGSLFPHWPESMRQIFSLEECDSLVAGEGGDPDLETRNCSGSRAWHRRRACPRPALASTRHVWHDGQQKPARRHENLAASPYGASPRRRRADASSPPGPT